YKWADLDQAGRNSQNILENLSTRSEVPSHNYIEWIRAIKDIGTPYFAKPLTLNGPILWGNKTEAVSMFNAMAAVTFDSAFKRLNASISEAIKHVPLLANTVGMENGTRFDKGELWFAQLHLYLENATGYTDEQATTEVLENDMKNFFWQSGKGLANNFVMKSTNVQCNHSSTKRKVISVYLKGKLNIKDQTTAVSIKQANASLERTLESCSCSDAIIFKTIEVLKRGDAEVIVWSKITLDVLTFVKINPTLIEESWNNKLNSKVDDCFKLPAVDFVKPLTIEGKVEKFTDLTCAPALYSITDNDPNSKVEITVLSKTTDNDLSVTPPSKR
ncbi:hypothetical protein EG68_06627, partial [Paragonimus skrjabini miyazakii]